MDIKNLPLFPYQDQFLCFYSSYFDSYTTDPRWMLIPIDDHGFHRGDGVFEAIKWSQGRVWLLEEHLQRLFQSAQNIGLKCLFQKEDLKKIIFKMLAMLPQEQQIKGIFRVYLTRGPGSFGVSPKDTLGTQVYIVATKLKDLPEKWFTEGVTVGWSQVPAKIPFLARTKTLNYLTNVLMKKECEERGLDFIVGLDEERNLTESYTENIFIQKDHVLYLPPWEGILKGTTLSRFLELVTEHKKVTVMQKKITQQQVLEADSLFVIGTTLDILWVQKLEDTIFCRPKDYDNYLHLIRSDQ